MCSRTNNITAGSIMLITPDAVLRVVVSGVIADNRRIPRKWFNAVNPLLNEFAKWNDTLGDFETSKPQTWLKTGLRVATMVVEQEHAVKVDPVERYLVENQMETSAPDSLEFVLEDILAKLKTEVALQTSSRTIYKVFVSPDTHFLLVKDTPIVVPENGGDNGEDYVGDAYLPDDVEKANSILTKLGDMFWANGHSIIFVDKHDDELLVKDHKLSGRIYKGETLDMVMSMSKFKEHKIRRVVTLQGSPGTGKSTLCENVADAIGERVIVLSNAIISNVDRETWVSLMDIMRPNLVIIDDIDRVGSNRLENSLYLFEDNQYNVPLTLLTTNDKDRLPLAFRRPGRIDMVFEMPTPAESIKREIVLEFARTMGIDKVPDTHIGFLMDLMDRFPGAYIKELMLRYKAYGFGYDIPENDMVFGGLKPILEKHLMIHKKRSSEGFAIPSEVEASMSHGDVDMDEDEDEDDMDDDDYDMDFID